MRPDIKNIKPYLHEVDYEDYDVEKAIKWFKKLKPDNSPVLAGCSSIIINNILGRNYDWFFDESAEFVIRTIGHIGKRHMKYSTLGIASAIPGLTEEVVNSGEDAPTYDYLPFFMTDGINSQGLAVTMNIVPAEKGDNSFIKAQGEAIDDLCLLMIPRWILDHYATAEEAGNDLLNNYNLYLPRKLIDMGYDLHFFIKDPDGSVYLVEFENGKAVIVNATKKPYMTNFHINGVKFNKDGKIYTPADAPEHQASYENGVTKSGQGLERYNLIVDMVNQNLPLEELLKQLNYTRCYGTHPDPSNPFWFTEYVGGSFTVDTPSTLIEPTVKEWGEKFQKRTRNGETSQTVHSCIYETDLAKDSFSLRLVTQEDYTQTYLFKLKNDTPVVKGGTMIYEKSESKYFSYADGHLVHKLNFWGLDEEHTDTYPNTDREGNPIAPGSKYYPTDVDKEYTWTGLKWRLNGDEPGPEPKYADAQLKAFNGTLNASEESLIKIPVGESVEIPYDIDDHKYSYLPTPDTKDTKFFVFAEGGQVKYDLDYEKKIMKLYAEETVEAVAIIFFGADICSLEHEGFDHVPCSYKLKNCELFLNEDNISHFLMDHNEATKEIIMLEHETYFPESIVWPACFSETSLINDTIKFNCTQNAINYSFRAHYGEPPVPPKEKEFKAVIDKYGLMTFFYDELEHEGIVYPASKIPTAATSKEDWPWYKDQVLQVVADSSCKEYVTGITSARSMFEGCQAEAYSLTNLDLSQVTTCHSMFKSSAIAKVDFPDKMGSATTYHAAFYNCDNLEQININMLDFSKVTDMASMFEGCANLKYVNMNDMDTVSLKDMSCLFLQCTNLDTVEFANFNTESVTDMRFMFSECTHLTYLNLMSFKTYNVTEYSFMFNECINLAKIEVWETFNVDPDYATQQMFQNCKSLVGSQGTAWSADQITAEYARIDRPAYNTPGYLFGSEWPPSEKKAKKNGSKKQTKK